MQLLGIIICIICTQLLVLNYLQHSLSSSRWSRNYWFGLFFIQYSLILFKTIFSAVFALYSGLITCAHESKYFFYWHPFYYFCILFFCLMSSIDVIVLKIPVVTTQPVLLPTNHWLTWPSLAATTYLYRLTLAEDVTTAKYNLLIQSVLYNSSALILFHLEISPYQYFA